MRSPSPILFPLLVAALVASGCSLRRLAMKGLADSISRSTGGVFAALPMLAVLAVGVVLITSVPWLTTALSWLRPAP